MNKKSQLSTIMKIEKAPISLNKIRKQRAIIQNRIAWISTDFTVLTSTIFASLITAVITSILLFATLSLSISIMGGILMGLPWGFTLYCLQILIRDKIKSIFGGFDEGDIESIHRVIIGILTATIIIGFGITYQIDLVRTFLLTIIIIMGVEILFEYFKNRGKKAAIENEGWL